MELIQRDLFQLQPAQASLTGLDQMFRSTVSRPLSGAGALQATLGCDHQIVWIRVERLMDELFADVGPVRVGGVNEIDAQLDRTTQHRLRLLGVGWRTPMPSPVIRIAPKPRRLTVRSPPTSIVPAIPACRLGDSDMDHDSFALRHRGPLPLYWHICHSAPVGAGYTCIGKGMR